MTRSTDHVVICVFDGLRPEFVTRERTPNLVRFAESGTWFREARSIFPSETRPASASIATGAPPSIHGVIGNYFGIPEVGNKVLEFRSLTEIARVEERSGRPLVDAETFADVLARHGRKLAVVHTASPAATFMMNPQAARNGHWTFSIHGRDASVTPEAVDEAIARFGPLPERDLPRFAEIDYAERVFREHVLERIKPDVALLWFNEPDTSSHYRFLGSDETLSVLKAVDEAFGRVLGWIEEQSDDERYTIIVASDHGHITTTDTVPLHDLLRTVGHESCRPEEPIFTGTQISVTRGNTGEIRITEGGIARRDEIARWLMEQDFLGMLFSPGGNGIEGDVPGTFSLSLVGLNHARAPDLVYVLRSFDDKDVWGNPGISFITPDYLPAGGSMHGGLSTHELNTVLIGAGPHFTGGVSDHRACGIIDIASTVLAAFGLPPAATMSDRSLLEASSERRGPVVHEVGIGRFRQRLTSVDRGRSRILLGGGRIA
ncbi:alkaline phosphatase family protein [Bosea caraganae]|uniref:Alkaline phosphatase family protein n=1 Tax=Bosea caraganae TaxID=2763117 RepID=A0A370LAQ2_9HYPH|nr:nucleotide pyrophosphatase/phosphodiesterase family protein [Bosea caraganae]RDJ27025.1 alkaline phosphatase family protein [Bosea caraganae]RDJ29042.1 alkaline phosphatase family protein [Bosea caraganae]